jgi:hemerythrin-like domain-containing protein
MKPTTVLSQEHQSILLMISILGNMADRLEAGEKVEAVHLEEAVDFVKGFADKCHHAKEEDLLFPAMEKAGIPRTGGPLGVMLREHTEGRALVKAMTDSMPGIRKGDKAAARLFAESARGYGALLSQHIYKEDLLFPAMEKAGIPRTGGPLGVMLREHTEGRALVKAMTDSMPGIRKGDKAAARLFAESARGYGALLSQHIYKEDNILYPMADARLSAAAQDELTACFADVEKNVVGEGRHEEFHALLQRLEELYLR